MTSERAVRTPAGATTRNFRYLESLQIADIWSRKLSRTVLCFAHGEGASVAVVMCVTSMCNSTAVRSLQNDVSIFGLPKHRHFVAKTAPYIAALCTRGRGECGSCGVLAKRAFCALVLRYDRPKFVEQRVDLWAPGKMGRNYLFASRVMNVDPR